MVGAGSVSDGGSWVEPAGTSPERSVVPASRTGSARASRAETPSSATRTGGAGARDDVFTEAGVCRTWAAASDRGLSGCAERPGEQGRRGRLADRRGIVGLGIVGRFGIPRRRLRSRRSLSAGPLTVDPAALVREHPADRRPESVGMRPAHGQAAPGLAFEVHEPGRGHAGVEEEQRRRGLGTQHVGAPDHFPAPVASPRHGPTRHDRGRSTAGVESVHATNVPPGDARPGDLVARLGIP